jgi:hypothetical protein
MKFYNIDRNQRFCNNCSKHTVEDEYHFMLECSKYNDLRKEYIQTDYWWNSSAYKLILLLSVRNIKELNNVGKCCF